MNIPGIPTDVALRANIKASLQTIEVYIRMGNPRRAASLARELADKLEQLGEIEQPNDRPRHRVVEPPPAPRSGAEFVGEVFSTGVRRPRKRRMRVEEVPSQGPPALPDPS